MYRVNILGGGPYGCMLAKALAKKLNRHESDMAKIKVFEKSQEILGSWSSINVNDHLINAGFYGLEMPRAIAALNIMHPGISEDDLDKVVNFKMVCIEDQLIPFREIRKEWPAKLTKNIQEGLGNNELMKIAKENRNDGGLLSILNKISKRYSDDIKDSWHLIYPWFFPYEYDFTGNDEGERAQRLMKSGRSDSFYYIPKDGLFKNLKGKVEKDLRGSGIEVKTSWHPLNLHKFLEDNRHMTENIWCASAQQLAKALGIKLDTKITGGERYLSILVLEISQDQLKEIETQYGNLPSEILYACKNSISLARSSFSKISQGNSAKVSSGAKYIIAELFTEKEVVSDNEKYRAVETIEKSLSVGKLKILGCSKTRRFDITNPEKAQMAEIELREKIKGLNIRTPYLYWWPINMAKCGEHARDDSSKIASQILLKNK